MKTIEQISERIKTQDNRSTMNPMFCVQIKVRDVGFDSNYSSNSCWHNSEQGETVYEEPDDLQGWEEFGYNDRWETVMVAFTEKGCEEYLDMNGHNDKRKAHDGDVRIYAMSFNRCPEMIAIRELLLGQTK